MLMHCVYFWLKDGLSEEDLRQFRAGLERLAHAPNMHRAYIGVPATTPDRPVVDHSYTFSLTAFFDDIAAHNDYQAHDIHQRFVQEHAAYWTNVQVYDSEVSQAS